MTPIQISPPKNGPNSEKVCTQDLEMKHWAQRSFICYLRSFHLQSNKKVYTSAPNNQVSQLTWSMAMPPNTQFLRQKMARHLVSFSVEEEGNCKVLQTKRIPITPIQRQSHASITFMSYQVQAGRIHL